MDILKFIGRRLREARELFGLTQEEAAKRLGITREYLSLLEAGKRRLPMRLLAKAAELYGRPESWFYGIGDPVGSLQMLLRKTEEASLSEETKRQLVKFAHLCEEIANLRKLLNHPVPELPTYPVTKERLEEQARQAARAERERLGLDDDPAPNLADILETHGIPVIRLPMTYEVSGAMAYDAEMGGFILVNAQKPPTHQLWTVAHEYGHLLKDRQQGFNLPEMVRETDGEGDAKRVWIEVFANRFATHFLMPEETVRRLVESVGSKPLTAWRLIELRRTFGVSYAALLYRLKELDYLTEREFEKWRQEKLMTLEQFIFGEPKTSTREEFRTSKVLWELTVEAAMKGEITLSYAAEVLGITPMEVQDILYELEGATVEGA
ncbi:hypothetical protein HRbin17_01250 [bacterium HR17]|uniref:HTH cro/C1-type domain-containing protein n=1 Tax=Candidatus Fervidibacter japonicus TaxID=2035412 RepID=A0A2H5XC28_9BACT|nr:hypothetical protein HRbin17_01250 [bacterium HR17]